MGKSLGIKIASIIFYILLSISFLLGVIFYFINGSEAPMLVYTYILTGVVVVLTLMFTIIGMFQSKKSLISSLIVIGLFGLLVLGTYLAASDTMPNFFGVETFDLTSATLKWIDTSLFMLYILMGVSFIGLLYTEIVGAFK